MGTNRNKNFAAIEKVAVWRIKFTAQQAQVFWEMFSARPGAFGERMDSLISKDDFFSAAKQGKLVIKKAITDIVMGIPYLIDVHVWDGGTYTTPLTSPYLSLRGKMLHGEKIFEALHHKVGNAGDTEITWIEKMLNLVVEE